MTVCLACPSEAVKGGYCHECRIILTMWQAKVGHDKTVLHGLLRLVKTKIRCHGYQNGCICESCMIRASKPDLAPVQPAQPWDA